MKYNISHVFIIVIFCKYLQCVCNPCSKYLSSCIFKPCRNLFSICFGCLKETYHPEMTTMLEDTDKVYVLAIRYEYITEFKVTAKLGFVVDKVDFDDVTLLDGLPDDFKFWYGFVCIRTETNEYELLSLCIENSKGKFDNLYFLYIDDGWFKITKKIHHKLWLRLNRGDDITELKRDIKKKLDRGSIIKRMLRSCNCCSNSSTN